MDFKTVAICPESPSSELHSWQLLYITSHQTAMHRLVPGTNERATSRNIATIKFPKVIWPGCGPTITFQPHEVEIKKRGLRHGSPTDRFMACTGRLSTSYGIDLSALGGARVKWKAPTRQEPESAWQGRELEQNPRMVV
ncbi:hypothetical protein DOTSEDRAFT_28019 [Dothistroma septosporum NZE10]|uniref:Uncharacterized protein n=1 Tax=Dothistroma septosporum (strain NZE10 / CBS 128990) TaxID=675120 RepID=N1PDC0_DOTSN|nr:hypothetical protein DOTSEDRAFT_28019 [Dothistroma septosporum NZE10]